MNTLVFDIETVPDVVLGRKVLGLPQYLDDFEVAEAMFLQREAKTGHRFLPHHFQKVVAISVVVDTPDWVKVWTLGGLEASEKEIIERFFLGLQKYLPVLVSWNGGGFDLPVLHYRSLKLGVSSPTYWETGEFETGFKWNNYLNRFHYRHTDLMDVLSGYQSRAVAPLDEIALMLGLPGKMGLKGDQVWPKYLDGDIKGIRDYCETDVLNTYLVYLKFQMIRGHITDLQYANQVERLRIYLETEKEQAHLQEFLENWQDEL